MPTKETSTHVEDRLGQQSETDLALAMGHGEIDVSCSAKVVTLRTIRDEEVKQGRDDIRRLGVRAIDYLMNFLEDPKAPKSSKAKTSLEILKLGGHVAGGNTGGGVSLNMSDEAFSRVMEIGREVIDVETVESSPTG